ERERQYVDPRQREHEEQSHASFESESALDRYAHGVEPGPGLTRRTRIHHRRDGQTGDTAWLDRPLPLREPRHLSRVLSRRGHPGHRLHDNIPEPPPAGP